MTATNTLIAAAKAAFAAADAAHAVATCPTTWAEYWTWYDALTTAQEQAREYGDWLDEYEEGEPIPLHVVEGAAVADSEVARLWTEQPKALIEAHNRAWDKLGALQEAARDVGHTLAQACARNVDLRRTAVLAGLIKLDAHRHFASLTPTYGAQTFIQKV